VDERGRNGTGRGGEGRGGEGRRLRGLCSSWTELGCFAGVSWVFGGGGGSGMAYPNLNPNPNPSPPLLIGAGSLW
jgi:hypothetical protein